MAALASDWLRHFRLLLWNGSTEFNETWQEVRSQRPLPSLCFSVGSEKQDGRPGLWLAECQIPRLRFVTLDLTLVVAYFSFFHFYWWPDCKAIPAYGLMMSVRLSTFWLTSAFKFVLGHINQYRLDTLHRLWWDLLNCDLSLWLWPWLFLFKVT